ncbi:MAG: outer membrane protein transport protein [Hydrogenothermaceae bacterium]|nr:outer membrane protein transport protein [Hydrogenothermaceae bacterium]
MKRTLIIGCMLIISQKVLGDEYHYRNFLPGDRAGGMGGAYTAVADDPSGAFYNPAGLALMIGNKLSVNVNAYHIAKKSYLSILPKTTGGANNWDLVSSKLIPNFFGIAHKLGPGVLAFSYAVVDATSRDQEQIFYNIKSAIPNKYITRYAININDDDTIYNIGPSYSVKLADSISVGATLYAHYRSGKIIRNHLLTLNDSQFEWSNTYLSFSEYGVKPILGTIISPIDKVSFGFTASKIYLLHSENRLQYTYRGIASAGFGVNDVNFYIHKTKDKRDLPYEFKVGVAYFHSPRLLVSADSLYYTKTDDYKEVLNWSVGTEYYIKDNFALRAGFFTDLSNTPKLNPYLTDQRENINNYGITFSGSYFTKNTSISIGLMYVHGKGEAQVISGSRAIQDVRSDYFTVFIGSNYLY